MESLTILSAIESFTIAHEKFLLTLFTLAIAWFTGTLYLATRGLLRTAKKQSEDTAESIRISGKSVFAMQDVAQATRDNASLLQGIMHKQMRAYVAVDLGLATYQDERLRFAAQAVLVNTGFTPARNISSKIRADILPVGGSELIDFPDAGPLRLADATLAPRQNFVVHGVVDHRYSDEEVALIMKGDQKRLVIWGDITYDDVFGGHWLTKFCHTFVFYQASDGEIKVNGYFYAKHNNAT